MRRARTGSLVAAIAALVATSPGCDDGTVAPSVTPRLYVFVEGFPPGEWYGVRELSLIVDRQSHPFTVQQPRPRAHFFLEPGDHTVRLEGLPSGVPADCVSKDGSERQVTLSAGVEHRLTFSLVCTWGTLQVQTETTGVDPDPDGYGLEVRGPCYPSYYGEDPFCQTTVIPVPANGTAVGKISETMDTFAYEVELTGVTDNCAAPDTQILGYPARAQIALLVTCARVSGSRAGSR